MIKTYFSVLISKGILVRADESENFEVDHYISYNIAEGTVLLGKTANDEVFRINYVQLIHEPRGNYWAAQLEGLPAEPICVPENWAIDVEIYKRVGLYD